MRVTGGQHFLGGLAARSPRLLRWLARRESQWLADGAGLPDPGRPIFITGLARAGTTILLEKLARHPATASHRYRDFPFPQIPLMWNWFLARAGNADAAPQERAHGDRLMVTANSPEAMEEPLWTSYFAWLHDPARDQRFAVDARYPAFEAAYRAHMSKIIHLRGGDRYLAKNNYLLARLAYLLARFPDARVVVPVRAPVDHIASLMRQQARFIEAAAADPRTAAYMRHSRHFEFGRDRRPLHMGEAAETAEIISAWRAGEEVAGWARYWAVVHRHLLAEVTRENAAAGRILLVDYDALCAAPEAGLTRIFAHCDLPATGEQIAELAADLAAGDYYAQNFDAQASAIIADQTAALHRSLTDLAAA